jgi:hypothetical protein
LQGLGLQLPLEAPVESWSHRRVLGRIEAILRSSDDSDLAALFDAFTVRFAGQAMPKAEHLGRRGPVSVLAVLVFVIGVVLVAATTGFAIATTSPGVGRAPNAKLLRPCDARSLDTLRIPIRRTCKVTGLRGP